MKDASRKGTNSYYISSVAHKAMAKYAAQKSAEFKASREQRDAKAHPNNDE